jgi:hypothetical protein
MAIVLRSAALATSAVVLLTACGGTRPEATNAADAPEAASVAAGAGDASRHAPPLPHLGQGATVLASSTHLGAPGEGPAANLVDGDPATRWSSENADNQEVLIDLHEEKSIARLRLMWDKAAARVFTVQISANGSTWSVPIQTTSGVKGPRTDEIPIAAAVRYIRIGLKQRSIDSGFSLDEVVVLGK